MVVVASRSGSVVSLSTIFPFVAIRIIASPFFVCKPPGGRVTSGVRRQAIVSLIIGATLGCVAGAMLENRQIAVRSDKPYVLSVNQQTGKPQLHVQGKPELE